MNRSSDWDNSTVWHNAGDPVTEMVAETAAGAATEAGVTQRFAARDDSAPFTVPHTQPGVPSQRINDPSQMSQPSAALVSQRPPRVPIRIGNGVTDIPLPTGNGQTPRTWLGRATRVLSSILTVVLVAAAAWTAWQWWAASRNNVKVTAVAVAPAQVLDNKCDVQYDIVGTLTTNGKAGIISYEWTRSDGQTSGTLKQSAASGQKTIQVHLYWRFSGEGSVAASATLTILDPASSGGPWQTAQIPYSCA